ncbi:tRNA-specific 2-thiouridylase MnmA [Capsulimonas corticalis]|uniref:tRNA-specific 2-thiouridylase MnmA n=1 Tax=Capsulimonas corticalis TaxID=2219043 RepID=A0A402CZZ9_9BACT|nr:tRNA 2-thiouridine(34) synthase MnmA [Capsulimonas corticalis]BDI33843.1 tRNA-specific 2-thiouridylase MnmA [Capsulimonas corticalis]
MSTKPTVVVAMSGGVDSSVAAGLLLRQGYNVLGITMQIWQESTTQTKGAGCCSLGAVEDARRVAAKLGIPHYVMNFREFFAEKVIDNFISEYKNGRTPNPCVNCNRYVKFDALLSKAQDLGAEYLATGHYARVEFHEDRRRWTLRRALDHDKDQTYALYHFTQPELEHTLMPLGLVTNKAETRAIAEELGLLVSNKPDSQEICFVQGGSYTDFLADAAPETVQPGDIVDTTGKRRGSHDGIAFYTIGQRKRVNVGSPIPLYVVGIDAKTNTITVGGNDDLLEEGLIADDVNWIGLAGIDGPLPIMAKIRYNMDAVPAVVSPGENGSLILKFDQAQRAVTPGQSLVMYEDNGDSVIGGGTIQQAFK